MRVRLFAAAAEAAGCEERTVGGATTLRELCEVLVREHGAELGTVLARCSFLVDGVRGDGDGDMKVPAGATVDVLPPFAGG